MTTDREIQHARRAAFEANHPTPCWVTWNAERADYYSLFRDSARKRQAENYSAKWIGFNAALDCIVIELPAVVVEFHEGDDQHNITLAECRAAIESNHLGIKVK